MANTENSNSFKDLEFTLYDTIIPHFQLNGPELLVSKPTNPFSALISQGQQPSKKQGVALLEVSSTSKSSNGTSYPSNARSAFEELAWLVDAFPPSPPASVKARKPHKPVQNNLLSASPSPTPDTQPEPVDPSLIPLPEEIPGDLIDFNNEGVVPDPTPTLQSAPPSIQVEVSRDEAVASASAIKPDGSSGMPVHNYLEAEEAESKHSHSPNIERPKSAQDGARLRAPPMSRQNNSSPSVLQGAHDFEVNEGHFNAVQRDYFNGNTHFITLNVGSIPSNESTSAQAPPDVKRKDSSESRSSNDSTLEDLGHENKRLRRKTRRLEEQVENLEQELKKARDALEIYKAKADTYQELLHAATKTRNQVDVVEAEHSMSDRRSNMKQRADAKRVLTKESRSRRNIKEYQRPSAKTNDQARRSQSSSPRLRVPYEAPQICTTSSEGSTNSAIASAAEQKLNHKSENGQQHRPQVVSESNMSSTNDSNEPDKSVDLEKKNSATPIHGLGQKSGVSLSDSKEDVGRAATSAHLASSTDGVREPLDLPSKEANPGPHDNVTNGFDEVGTSSFHPVEANAGPNRVPGVVLLASTKVDATAILQERVDTNGRPNQLWPLSTSRRASSLPRSSSPTNAALLPKQDQPETSSASQKKRKLGWPWSNLKGKDMSDLFDAKRSDKESEIPVAVA
ncbi:hypothetical protein FA15DRAFT_691746 [Coprinopsis marcescibilis]|uniref:Uncharacterized protein n=1 Tax=Coprinopsis marcescibilis TaxID=230819 RepID=A0A5C3L6S1_COPMA|nr:hypothetical protein FA15DRAFT_691746 [Coprinopsis marcescibilis]